MSDTNKKDIIIEVYPDEGIVTMKSGSFDGMSFMKQEFGLEKQTIQSDSVNLYLDVLIKQNLKFSFRLPKKQSK